jgi:GTP-binding protein
VEKETAMKVFSFELVKSCLAPGDYPSDNCPEIAFGGRSNVGKSSAINALLGHKGIARISSIPGKTRQINFFKINRSFYFVDLPGYGYARVSKEIKASWASLLEHYLMNRNQLKGVVLLLDARHPPTDLDLQMKIWLEHAGVPLLVVMTKMDKVSSGDWRKVVEDYPAVLGLNPAQTVIAFSARTRAGKELLWRSIESLLANPSPR